MVKRKNVAKSARDFYYLGQYKEASEQKVEKESAPYILAAKCFRGEHGEARRLYERFKSSFNVHALAFTDFHLGLSYTRTSEYDEAQNLFVNNWKRRHLKELGALERFFIYQGLAFFRFFFSRHQKSLVFSNRAYDELMTLEKPPALPLALVCDLMGHNFYQLGQAAKGKLSLEKALDIATQSGFTQLKAEFEASLTIYNSHFDLKASKSIKSLKKLLKATPEENDYTRSELVLQVAKLLFLQGAYKKANDFLIQNFNTIYKNDNKRKVAKLNTLLAQLLIPKGQYIEALSLCKVAKGNLNERIDINLLAPILGIEQRILNLLGQDSKEQESLLNQLLLQTDKGILLQVNSRLNKGLPLRNEQDQLGVLFDEVFLKEDIALEKIVEHHLFHMVVSFFGPFSKDRVIIPHPQNKGIFLVDENEILYRDERLTNNLRLFFIALQEGPQTKEKLIKKIWGYQEYDPFRHDHLIYTLVRRARRYLESKGDWIQTGEDSYQFSREVEFFVPETKKKTKGQKETSIQELPEGLNFRQCQILEGIFEDGFKASDVGDYFKVTRMTAYRDLNELVELGYLKKRGKGRATCYLG